MSSLPVKFKLKYTTLLSDTCLPCLAQFCRVASDLHAFGFRNNNFILQSKVVSPVSNPQPGGLGPSVYVPQLHPQDQGSLLPSLYVSALRRCSTPPPHGEHNITEHYSLNVTPCSLYEFVDWSEECTLLPSSDSSSHPSKQQEMFLCLQQPPPPGNYHRCDS
jgi:hypothetical protein